MLNLKPIFFAVLTLTGQCSFGQCCRCQSYGPELVNNGDFTLGNVGFTTSYSFSTNASPGRYGITTNSNSANPLFWGNCLDHTTGTGNLIWYDLSSSSSINMWTQQISNITPNSNYLFSCWVNTLDPSGPATLRFSINGVLVGNSFTAPGTLCNWAQKCFVWNSGISTSATITITNQSTFASGNDVGIDDISFRRCTPFSTTFPEASICSGQTHQLPNGTLVGVAGIYIDTLQTQDGCDSLRISSVTVKPNSDTTLNISICEGQSYLGYSNTGVYYDTITAFNGCDSVRKLNLFVKTRKYSAIDKTICEGDSYLGYSFSGVYIDTFLLLNGCDSIRTLNLVVAPNYFSNITKTICKGQSFLGHTAAGIYTDTLLTIYKCDSIIRTNLLVVNSCEVYFPTAFSPNNDGMNDIFNIINGYDLENYTLNIFNRWGQRVFMTNDYRVGWAGKYNGIIQPTGVYVWCCTFEKENKTIMLKGTVMLIR